jgi:hypothetical protein
MVTEVEIIQPESFELGPKHLESQDSVTTGNPLASYAVGFLTLLLAVGFIMSRSFGDDGAAEQGQSTTTLTPRDQSGVAGGGVGEAESESANAHQAELAARRTTIQEWTGGQSLIVVENSQFIYEVDLANGRRTSWAPPEVLIDADPLIVGAEVVVIGLSGAWIGQPFDAEWRFLGEADRVMPSSEIGRMWIRTNIGVSDSSAIQFRWTEVDATGQAHRTMSRDRKVRGPSPEITFGSEEGVLRLTESESNPWRVFSDRGVPIAMGLNDIVVAECSESGDCEPVWYDPRTGLAKAGFFPDLARNLLGQESLLSPDGRFAISQVRSGLTVNIASVANGNEIQNECVWGETLVWSFGSQLLACATASGAQLIDTTEGKSLGVVVTSPDKWTRMAFIETAKISRLR